MPSIDENFRNSYAAKGIQPGTGVRGAQTFSEKPNASPNGVRNIRVAKRATGTAMQATGVGMQVAGKGMKVTGKAATRAGASLSSTGIGAIVGVPLMAIGGVSNGVGTGVDVAGKQVRRTGKRMTRNSRFNNKKVAGVRMKGLSVHARAFLTGSFFAAPILILAFLEFGTFLLALAVDAVTSTEQKNGDGVIETIWKFGLTVVKGTFDGVSGFLKDMTGIDLNAIVGALYPGNYFILFYIATLGFCIMTLMSVWAVYEFSGSKPLSGNGAGAKKAAFLLTICLYCLPIVHMFPWFLLWSYTILRNDK